MRRTIGLLALAGIVAAAIAQGPGATLLNSFAQKLNSADTVSSTYTIQVIGTGGPEDYSVSLKKPNLARIDMPTQLIVADGKQIITYDKAEKTYVKKPQTEQEMKALFSSDELNLFAGFFAADAYKAAGVKSMGAKKRKGQDYETVQASVDASGRKTITYFLAPDSIARVAQFDLNDPAGKMTYIVDTKTFDVGKAVADDAFAFVPPADAKEVSLEDLNSDKWYTSLEEGQKMAAKTNKMLLVDFYADW